MKKMLSFMLALALLISLPVLAMADVAMERAPNDTGAAVTNDFDCVYYNNGNVVYNNGGIVFNNEGTVYNNGGTVYLNGGTCYNNGGTVFRNAGELFNNDGKLIDSGASESATKEADEAYDESADKADKDLVDKAGAEPERYSLETLYEISLPDDYSRFAMIEGFTEINGKYYAGENDSVTISVRPGYTLLNSFVTTGKCTIRDENTVVFSDVRHDGTLSLKFQTDAPVLSPKFGAYGEKQELSFICADDTVVYYLIDETEDIKEKGKVYTAPISIEKSCYVQYYAQASGAEPSLVCSGYYVFPEVYAPEFEPQHEGYKPIKPAAISVKNTGMDKIKVQQVALSGRDKDFFILSSTEGARVSPGIREEHSWFISPVDGLKAGSYSCNVDVTYASGSTTSAELSFEVKK